MNTTILNKDELKRSAQDLNLGQFIRQLESEFQAKGQVICQFRLNGLSLSESDEKRLAHISLDEVHQFEVDSEAPKDLLFGLLENWIAELPVLVQKSDELAKNIKFKGVQGYLKNYVDLVDSCQFLMESLLHLENIIKSDLVQTDLWKKAEIQTAAAIKESIKAFELKDYVLLSEILEYDLANSLQIWQNHLKYLIQKLREENAKDISWIAKS